MKIKILAKCARGAALSLLLSGCGGAMKSKLFGSISQSSLQSALVTITAPQEQALLNGMMALTGTCTDGLPVRVSGDLVLPVNDLSCVSGQFSLQGNLTTGDGPKTIRVSQLGANKTEAYVTRTFRRDTVAPVLTLITPLPNANVKNSVAVQGVCETGIGVQVLERSTTYEVPCANGAFATTLTLTSVDGAIALTIAQTDAAGNRSQSLVNVLKDTLAPVVTISSPAVGSTVTSQANVSGSCESGLNVQINGSGLAAPVSVACANNAFTALVVFTAGAGSKTMQVAQTDLAGNTASATRDVTRLADVSPVISITSPSAGTLFQNTLTVNGTCVTGLSVAFSGAGWMSPATAACNGGAFSALVSFTNGDGMKNLVVSQTNAQALTGSASRSFTRDATAPVVTIASPAANSELRTNVSLMGACENGILLQASGTGAAQSASVTCANGVYALNVALSAGDGNKSIQVSQTDAIGNIGSVTRQFVRDTVAPNLTILAPAAGTSSTTGLTVSGACEGSYTVSASGPGISGNVSAACASASYSLNISFSAGDGAKTVQISQNDAAGNAATVSRDFTRTAPILDGAVLYAQNCAGCHGALATSLKLSRTSSQISTAIGTVASMSTLSFLTTAQRDAIAAVLVPAVQPNTQAFACDASVAPVNAPLQRLTKTQYLNTFSSLLTGGFSASDLTSWQAYYASSATQTLVSGIPNDGIFTKGNAMVYDTGDQRLSDTFVRGVFELAWQSAQWLVSDTARLNRFVKSYAGTACSSESLTNKTASTACLQGFINGFGLRALRRPLQNVNSSTDAGSPNPSAQNDMAFYTGLFTDSSNGGFDAIVTAMLTSPDAAFLTTFKGQMLQTNLIELTNFELAAKLSYYLTNSPPDDTLIRAAQASFTGAGNTLTEQIERLFASPLARQRMGGFYSQWMRPSLIPTLNATVEMQGKNLVNVRNDSIQEILDLAEYYTFAKADGKASDLVTSDISFAKNADLASFYGVQPWAGKTAAGGYTASALVQFSAAQPRAGMFTRAAYTFSGARDPNLILRGARLRRDFLCADMTPPANTTPDTSIPLIGLPTQRNVVTQTTSGGACVGCHASNINPLGFATQNYDAFGRFRLTEPLFDSAGNITQTVPIDAVVQPKINLADTAYTNDGVSFSQRLGASKEFNACFVRHYFRFAEGRTENLTGDACQMQKMYSALTDPSGGSLQGMIKSMAEDSKFKQRSFVP